MTQAIQALPWMTEINQQVAVLWAQQKMPHAICLHGQPGLGQRHQLAYMTSMLFCENKSDPAKPCGECRQCILFNNKEHPDMLILAPGDKSTSIGIDQIRQLTDFVMGTAYFAPMRIVIVDPLEAMTVAASNALLKMLEEPPPNVYFLVSTTKLSQLMPTIRSRLQFFSVLPPEFGAFCLWVQAVLESLEEPKCDHEVLYNAFLLAQKGPFLALEYILAHTKSQHETTELLFSFKRDPKQADLVSEYLRFQEVIKGPPAAATMHLGVLIKTVGVQIAFLFFDLWLEDALASLKEQPDAAAQHTRIEVLWQAYSRIQQMREDLVRSPQLNKVYLERELLDIWVATAT